MHLTVWRSCDEFAFFTFKNLPTALFTVQKIENLLVISVQNNYFSKILFFFQVLWVPDRLNTGCAGSYRRTTSVSTDTAVAAPRDSLVSLIGVWRWVSFRWEAGKASRCFSGFSPLSFRLLLRCSFFSPIVSSIPALPVCCSREPRSPVVTV